MSGRKDWTPWPSHQHASSDHPSRRLRRDDGAGRWHGKRNGMERSGATLGGLIRALRQRNGWTLRQMSEKVGIPLSTLAKVEGNKLSLTYDKLQQLTARLG